MLDGKQGSPHCASDASEVDVVELAILSLKNAIRRSYNGCRSTASSLCRISPSMANPSHEQNDMEKSTVYGGLLPSQPQHVSTANLIQISSPHVLLLQRCLVTGSHDLLRTERSPQLMDSGCLQDATKRHVIRAQGS